MANLPGYTRYRDIVLNSPSEYISGDQPVFVFVIDDGHIGTRVAEGGYVRFTLPGQTDLLPFDMRQYTVVGGSATGVWVVRYPVGLSAVTDNVVRMWYEAASPSDGSDPAATYPDDYELVVGFDEADAAFTDRTGKQTLSNNGVTYSASGKVGGAGSFGGSAAIDCGDSADYDFGTGDFTALFWVNLSEIYYSPPLSRAVWYGPWDAWNFEISSDTTYAPGPNYPTFIADGIGCHAPNTIGAGAWSMVSGVRASGAIACALNGEAGQTVSAPGNVDADRSLFIGRNADQTYPRNIHGVVDEVRVISTALTPAAIAWHYTNQASPANQTWGDPQTITASKIVIVRRA